MILYSLKVQEETIAKNKIHIFYSFYLDFLQMLKGLLNICFIFEIHTPFGHPNDYERSNFSSNNFLSCNVWH